MKVFRQVNESAYHYYVQHSGVTVLWYPAMAWQNEVVEGTLGKLLAEGMANLVLEDLWEVLPADLLLEIGKYPWPLETDSWMVSGETHDLAWSDQHGEIGAASVNALTANLT